MFTILLAALDGTSQTAHVIDLVSQVAQPGAAVIHLLCAVDPSYAMLAGGKSAVAPDGLVYPAADDETSQARAILATAAAQLATHDFTVKQIVCAGHPAEVIASQAKILMADVIVMGHRHLSRLRRWGSPSTADEVIEHAPCPVLIATRDDTSRL